MQSKYRKQEGSADLLMIDGNNFSSHELGKWKKVNILKFGF
jgi:hypothetical protein